MQAPYAGMMHDFVVTQRHVVLYLTNMVADMERIKAGGVHFIYDRQTPCYMGVMRRGERRQGLALVHAGRTCSAPT